LVNGSLSSLNQTNTNTFNISHRSSISTFLVHSIETTYTSLHSRPGPFLLYYHRHTTLFILKYVFFSQPFIFLLFLLFYFF
jgi:hypothetical protein